MNSYGFVKLTFLQTTIPQRNFRILNMSINQRPAFRVKGRNSTDKVLDAETGLYYFGARYLDPKTSRWMSADPAVSDYLPSAPVNDEAKKRNGNLPGQGGVFNYVNLHVYHYAGNNPVVYVDPDGNKIADISSRNTQNSAKNKSLPLRGNNDPSAFGKLGCLFTAIMNIINGNIADYSDKTKYFEGPKNDDLKASGPKQLLQDVTSDSFMVVKYEGKDVAKNALQFFNNSSADYSIIADVGSSDN